MSKKENVEKIKHILNGCQEDVKQMSQSYQNYHKDVKNQKYVHLFSFIVGLLP